jgi:hypothetical protein
MNGPKIDVPIEELWASTVFVRAKRAAKVRGFAMYVHRARSGFVATFHRHHCGRDYSFAAAIGFDDVKDVHCSYLWVAAVILRGWHQFLAQADHYYLMDWLALQHEE